LWSLCFHVVDEYAMFMKEGLYLDINLEDLTMMIYVADRYLQVVVFLIDWSHVKIPLGSSPLHVGIGGVTDLKIILNHFLTCL